MARYLVSFKRLTGRMDYFLRPFKPLLVYYVLKNYFQGSKERQRLNTLDISMGYECNMRCEHCSAQVMAQSNAQKLTLDDYHRLNKELDKLGLYRINITGGEPLLFPWLEELIKALKPARRHIKIQTNGTLLTEDRILSLKKAGVNAISMSLDSLDEKEFERFRGLDGSFKKIVNNINLVRKHGLQVSLGCVVTHQSINNGETEKLIRFAYEHKCHLLLNIAIAVGRWASQEEFLFDKHGDDRKRLNELLLKYSHVHTDHDIIGCPAAIRKLYLTPYGDIIPCPFLHVSFGNIKNETLSSIRNRVLENYPYYNSSFCPAAENCDVLEKWLKKLWDASVLPVDYRSVGALEEGNSGKIYILLPVHNRRNITENFIKCLVTQTYQNYHLVLMDDGSTDSTEDMVRKYIQQLTVLKGKGKWWWAGSLQQGVKWLFDHRVRPQDIILMINDDAEFGPEFLNKAVFLLNRHAGTLIQAMCYSRKTNLLLDSGRHISWKDMSFNPTSTIGQINCLSTRGLFLRAEALKVIGGFHPQLLPHYASDYEFTIRAHRKGLKLLTDPSLFLYVNEGSTGYRSLYESNVSSIMMKLFSRRNPSNPVTLLIFVLLACPWKYKMVSLMRLFAKGVRRIISILTRGNAHAVSADGGR